jgi:uncharacterized protein YecA (UPF0149 family)
MDCRTGEIHHMALDRIEQFEKDNGRKLLPLPAATARALTGESPARRKNYMRNQPCVCGSGTKFKRCCWNKYG